MEVSRRVRDWSVFCLLVSDEIGVSEIWHLWHSLKCVICWFFVTIVQTYFTLFFSISTAQRKCRFVFLSLDRGHNRTTHQQCQNLSSSWSHKERPSSHCLRSFCCKMKKTHTNTLNGFLLSISDTFVVQLDSFAVTYSTVDEGEKYMYVLLLVLRSSFSTSQILICFTLSQWVTEFKGKIRAFCAAHYQSSSFILIVLTAVNYLKVTEI